MEFTLLYDGPLKTNGTAKQKQEIRRVFHPQLKTLWQQLPLNRLQPKILKEEPGKGEISILQKVGDFTFAPLISEKLYLTAELNITFLRPEAPGSLITQGGDIDNRLKTLFDGLRMAKVESELPRGDKPTSNENPFYCVLEDDSLITRVSVLTDRLLQPHPKKNHVRLVIGVKTKITVGTWLNISIG